MTTLVALKKKWLAQPKVKHHYDTLSEEFSIASALIQARSDAGYTQDQVAEKMKTKQSVVSRMESGRIIPSLNSILRYAKAIGCRAKLSFESAS